MHIFSVKTDSSKGSSVIESANSSYVINGQNSFKLPAKHGVKRCQLMHFYASVDSSPYLLLTPKQGLL